MNAMYPAGYDPSAVAAQAQSYAPQNMPSFPQMFPAYYGPTHSALSQALQQALMQQAGNTGLLSSVTPQQMGLLSTDMPQANPVAMPTTGGGQLGPNDYYRLTPSFWDKIYTPPAKANPNGSNTASGSSKNLNPYQHDGSDGNVNHNPYNMDRLWGGSGLSEQGQRDLSEYGGIF